MKFRTKTPASIFFAVLSGAMILFIAHSAVLSAAEPDGNDSAGIEFFEKNIRPVLAQNCYMCHSAEAKTRMGGLSLDTREGIRNGGQSGHAIVPGSVDESLLLSAIRQDGKLKMPPMGKLSDNIIANFVRWVEMGAPDPRKRNVAPVQSSIDIEKGRQFWAFQPPRRPKAPSVKNVSWPKGAIDNFILAKLEENELKPVGDAERAALLRRASFDLTGLPPTPEEIETFLNDESPDAFRTVIDRLLESERFGERWGRHWLDVARYAESMGRTRNYPFPVAWRYRDYVIDAFNQDKPYDRFVAEQIAGDLLPYDSPEQHREQVIATGFLALGAHDLNEIDEAQFEADIADEQINATTRAFLALTVGCARCHDHKFDPIPTKDYYALAGIFRSTEIHMGLRRRPRFNAAAFRPNLLLRLAGLRPFDDPAAGREFRQKSREIGRQLGDALRDRDRQRVRAIANQLGELPLPQNLAMGVSESAEMVNNKVNVRGDPHTLGEEVPRGFVNVLYEADADLPKIGESESGRLQLAAWLSRRDNPLTARVMVNRIWRHLFGRGIVDSVDNFGKMGSQPSHPELLDYLAVRFMENGWSVKSIIREIMLSRAYQLSTAFDARNFEVEPDNRLLWRMNWRRLEIESIRDAILQISGLLDLNRPEASPVYTWPRAGEANRGNGGKVEKWEYTSNHRSVYIPVIRSDMPRMFETFDFPEPSETKGEREVTTVATQALLFLNNPWVLRQARTAAERALAAEISNEARVRGAYRQVLSRDPRQEELDRALRHLRTWTETGTDAGSSSVGMVRLRAWARLYHALFASAEFRYPG